MPTPDTLSTLTVVGVNLVYTIDAEQYAYTGAINSSIPAKPAGSIWIVGNMLCYSDTTGITRVIAAAASDAAAGKAPGSIFVKNNTLQWVSADPTRSFVMIPTPTNSPTPTVTPSVTVTPSITPSTSQIVPNLFAWDLIFPVN